MRFANPYSVYLIVIFLGFLAFLFWAGKARKKALEKFAQKQLLSELTDKLDLRRRVLKTVLTAVSFALLLTALSRPQWGFRWQEVKKAGLDILVALDTSKSMLASDVKPDRLTRSKMALRDLASKLKGDRIGLIAFSGSAFLQCPLTADYNGFLMALDDVDTQTIPKGGTSISSAIRQAVRSYSGGINKHKILVIITDGEDHAGDAEAAADEAKKAGIAIYCIGIGTSEGDLIFVSDDKGSREYLKDRSGNAVKSRLNEDILQKICLHTGGVYVRSAPTEFGLDLLYNEKFSRLEKTESQTRMNKLYTERFQLPLLAGLLLFCLVPFIDESRNKK